jgi:site-specific DNA-cytosine methylase
MKTFGSLFSGGGGADIGAKAAGLELAWGVEYVPEIAEVANANLGQHIKVANILDCSPFNFDRVDVLHASPPCPSFSVAKAGGTETDLDIALARKVAEFATVLQPDVFTLENVQAYQKSKSWRIIEQALWGAGYWLSVNVVNFADMGDLELCPLHDSKCIQLTAHDAEIKCNPAFLPKTLAPDIAAALAGMRPIDQATHLALDAVGHLVKIISLDTAANVVQQELERVASGLRARTTQDGRADDILMIVGMFVSGSTENLDVNIVSLLNKCLDAPLLKARLYTISMETRQITLRKILECIRATAFTWKTTMPKTDVMACPLCKSKAVPQTRRRMIMRAVRGGFVPYLPQAERWVGWYEAIEDIIDTLPDSQFAPWQLTRLPEEIKQTLMLWSMDQTARDVTVRYADQPVPTVDTASDKIECRAFIVDCQKAGDTTGERGVTIRCGDEPCFTLTSGTGQRRPARAYDGVGRVVAMTARALARFQSFPDAYILPESKTLAAKIIGNAVPPLGFQKIIGGLPEPFGKPLPLGMGMDRKLTVLGQDVVPTRHIYAIDK